jgi:hypothetical protein
MQVNVYLVGPFHSASKATMAKPVGDGGNVGDGLPSSQFPVARHIATATKTASEVARDFIAVV